MAKVATASAWSSKIEGRRMRILKVNEYTLLELAAFKPLSYLPCNHRLVAERLVKRGLLLPSPYVERPSLARGRFPGADSLVAKLEGPAGLGPLTDLV